MSGTSGTVKTDSALLTEFADGQPEGTIVPGYVRDVIVSKTAQIQAALPVATPSQLYAGTGVAGAAQAVSLGTGLALSGATLSAATLSAALSPVVIAAAGTTQATATAASLGRILVSSGSGGIELPLSSTFGGAEIPVINRTGAAITVYPASGDQIETNAVNVGVTLQNDQTGRFSVFTTGTLVLA
jgi:hypothetical protein